MSNTALLGSYGGQGNSSLMFRNRIINGDMRIDQRNAGASINPTDGQFVVDRFAMGVSQASKLTAQRSTVAPSGFSNSVLITSSSSYSALAADYFGISQRIEGFNVADLAWGTADAKPVTLSFWVRSSLTGTFAGSFRNSAGNRSYPFNYTINAANTWEQKSITVSGDVTGTWLSDSGIGITMWFSLGSGSNYNGTAGSWSAGNFVSTAGATSLVGTNGATLYITGVQLEAETATPFERRPIGTELALCQRYFFRTTDWVHGTSATAPGGSYGAHIFNFTFPVTLRRVPTFSVESISNGGTGTNYTTADFLSKVSQTYRSTTNAYLEMNVSSLAGTVTAFLMLNGMRFDAEL